VTLQIGLTGSIGAGKSSVAQILREAGVPILDADAAASEVLIEPEVQAALVGAFGPSVVIEGGVNRPELANIVFNDDDARATLEAIVHPRVRAIIAKRLTDLIEHEPELEAVVHDIPLLYETGRAKDMDAVLVVDAPLEVRVQRVVERSGVDATDVRSRDAAQWPAVSKREAADVVIDNVGTLEDLRRSVLEAWPRVLAAARQRTEQAH